MKGKNNIRCCILLLALAIGWTVIGNLVNFHQHRIFGDLLLVEAFPFIKPKTEEKETLKTAFAEKQKQFFDYSAICTISEQTTQEFYFESNRLINPRQILLVRNSLYDNFPHRGPPSLS